MGSVSAQSDSLKNIIRHASHDSIRARLCNEYSAVLANSDVSAGIYFGNEALKYSKSCKNKNQEAFALINLGYSEFYSGNVDTALTLFLQSIVKAREAKDSSLVAMAFNRKGYLLRQKGELPAALADYNQALKSNKDEADTSEAAFSYLNIGLIYHDKKDYVNALKNEQIGLQLYRSINEEVKVANALARIGNIYLDEADSVTALDYYRQSYDLFKRNHHLRGMGIILNNMAMVYEGKGDFRKEVDMYLQALALRQQVGDKNGVSIIYNNVGGTYVRMNKFDSALYYLGMSMDIAKELNYKDILSLNYVSISATYEKMGDYDKALAYYKLYHQMYDTLNGDKNRAELNQLNTKYEAATREKQIQKLTLEGELKAEALDAEQKKFWLMIAAAVFLLLFVGVAWRSAVLTRRANVVLEQQKKEIASQKKIVEEQHHDILDSITYAQRIQRAVLPTHEDRLKLFPESFVFYRPRDIVSGDFWWMSNSGGRKLIAVGDCTGHGVPGAFMSLIGNTLMNEIVNEKKITDPGVILNQLSAGIGAALKQKEAEDPENIFSIANVKDGMDIALCAVDHDSGMLFYAGANNPLLYTKGSQIFEVKGDRQPIGYFDADKKPFTVHSIPLKDIESFYIFSDGFADQFGGAQGKKFKQSRLKEELQRMCTMKCVEQEKRIAEIFDEWKGTLEQVDDVCVVGVRIRD
ncbi:MAG TPA: tetratricopeptide repeat protein [Bacteroidia bacterium]|nr:tetratricopeptide repeat protein [Bacteroidia bacterium]